MNRAMGTALLAATTVAAIAASTLSASAVDTRRDKANHGLSAYKHIVVIYEENHSFDNLFGQWGSVNGRPVNGIASAPAARTIQVNQAGTPFTCLLQNDVNLTSPPLTPTCTDTTTGASFSSAFRNSPFPINATITPADTTCPAPGVFAANGVPKGAGLPGGCTEDLVHRYYQEQYQLNHGQMNRYVTGSDAVGLTMGYYDTTRLPLYQYLHGAGAPNYVIADNFFQAAFGGSFLNHQWLVSARTPVWPGAVSDGGPNDLHSVVGPDGMPKSYPLHSAPAYVRDNALTQWCITPPALAATVPAAPAGTTCGDYAVNTIQPAYQPYAPGTPDSRRLPPQTAPTIGDELSAKGVDWAWYSGGWDNADGHTQGLGWTNGATPGVCADPNHITTSVWPNCPDKLFQFHHQAFNYFAAYAPGTTARAAHLQDEADFVAAAKAGTLKPVSFVKPIGAENEHPGYASVSSGSTHLVNLIRTILEGPDGKNTLIIVTYDEFGGQWDHVPPPTGAGVSDVWGPGTRIPALVVSRKLSRSGVDHTAYDTTSILRTIEKRFHLSPLTSRDASVADMTAALKQRR